MERKDNFDNFTQAGESNIPQEIRNSSDFLPYIINTKTNKKFLETTFDQLISSGTTESIDYYWGRVSGSSFVYGSDIYNYETNSLKQNYQFSPGISYTEHDVTQSLSYINVINYLKNNGYDLSDLDRLFSNEGYTLDLPINSDMFVNYINYYWIEDTIPICEIRPTEDNPINITDILNVPNYTTPILSNGKSLDLINGMRITFKGLNVDVTGTTVFTNAIYIVGGVGKKIYLTKEVDENGKNIRLGIVPYSLKNPTSYGDLGSTVNVYDETLYASTLKEYVTIESSSVDANPWSRTNRWLSKYALEKITAFNDVDFGNYATTENRAKRPIIQFNSNIELFNSGNYLRETVDHLIDCNFDIDPSTDIQGQTQYTYGSGTLNDGDIILFLNATNSYFTNKVFAVRYVSNKITLVQTISTFNNREKVLIKNSNSINYVGAELYWNGSNFVYGQQKSTRGISPLFNLYDENAIGLSLHENSNFYGDFIFSYLTSTATIVDEELGISAKTNSLSPTEFSFTVSNKKYGSTTDLINYSIISGLYYYKNIQENELYTIWNPLKYTQRVPVIETKVADKDNAPVAFDIGTNYGNSTNLIVTNENGYYKWYTHDKTGITYLSNSKELFVLQKDKTYNLVQLVSSTNVINFYDINGNTDSNIFYETENNNIVLNISPEYQYSAIMYRNSLNTINGMIYLSENDRSINLYINGTISDQYNINGSILTPTVTVKQGDIFELSYISNDIDKTHDVAPIFKYNPFNQEVSSIDYSNIINHIQDQMLSNPAFVGSTVGNNNYHYISKLNTYGGKIRQQVYSPVNHSLFTSRETSEPKNAVRSVAVDYSNFKRYFKNKVLQLWNTNSWENVSQLVDTALTEINIGKNPEFKYANSDMVYYENGKSISYTISSNVTTFDIISEIHQLGYNKIPTYVWISEKQSGGYITKILKLNTDYTIVGKTITLNYNPTYTTQYPAILKITQYVDNSNSYVPFSSVKLGLEKPYEVSITNGLLQLHDGSYYALKSNELFDLNSVNFDPVGAALYELETRIVNNFSEIHYSVDNITSFAPKIKLFGSSIKWKEFKDSLVTEFYFWKSNFDYGNNSVIPCDPNDEFTWNYSTVGENIPSWRGIYLYNFGTTRPHTHPWEMLGHNSKPLWWDDNYSWTNTIKRQKLISSLKLGITGNPTLLTSYSDPNYALSHYDWDNKVLVTVGGILNGPVSAGVVDEPDSIHYVKPFVYGDMMYDDEVEWMSTSEYTYSLIISLMKFIPYKLFEKYLSVVELETKNSYYKIPQIVYNDTDIRSNPITRKIHGEPIENSGIISVNIKNSGSNYSAQATITAKISSTGYIAKFLPVIENGKIKAVTITDPGFGYKNDVELIINDPTSAGSGAVIIGKIITDQRYVIKPGLMATIVEYNNNIYNSVELKELISSVRFTPVVHLSGYSRKQNIDIKLDGSFMKGKVSIPKEDFEIVLTKNPFIKNIFYSGVRIEKTQTNSYRVWGYNKLNPQFTIYPTNVNSSVVSEKIDTYSIKRYLKFRNNTINIPYGTEFTKRQDLYDFMIGLGEYYRVNGFNTNWIDAANEVISWAIDETQLEDIYKNGIYNDTIIFNQGPHGTIDSFTSENIFNAKLLDKNGKSISSKNAIVIRNQTDTEIIKKTNSFELFGINVVISEYEHVIALNPISQFGDIIYNPLTGIGQNRIKISGQRTRNWNGKIEANGYLVSNDSIIGNIETSVREIENDYVNSQGKPLNTITSKTARFNVGYNEPSYLNLITSDDNAIYQFSVGERKYKGTVEALRAFTRNSDLFQNNDVDFEISENWMARIGDYGDKKQANPIQVELDKSRIKTNPQAVRFNKVPRFDKLDDTIIDISDKDTKYISGDFDKPISMLPIKSQNFSNSLNYTRTELVSLFENHLMTSGLPLVHEVTNSFKSVDSMNLAYDSSADYANIETWSSTKVYRQGDIVRLNGKVYKYLKETTSLNYSGGILYARGNVSFPVVTSGKTLIIGTSQSDLRTVTFDKTTSQTIYNSIVVDGTISNPVTNVNNTLVIDGKTIILQKTDNTTVYQPIEYIGTASLPLFEGVSNKTLIIDGLTIDLQQNITSTEQISSLAGMTTAIENIKSSTATSASVASARIQAFRNLRLAYDTNEQWAVFTSGYFSDQYIDYGLNINYLTILIENASESLTDKLTNLLLSDIEFINAARNTSYTLSSLPPNLVIDATLAEISASQETSILVSNFTSKIKDPLPISSDTIIIVNNSTYPIIWNVELLVDKLNQSFVQAGKPRLRAVKTPVNQLKIIKTAIAEDNTLVIGNGTANTDVGFSATTVTSTVVIPSSNIVTLNEIVTLINLASISNVRASSVTINGNTVLRLSSTNPTMTISGATANADIGLIATQYSAQVSQNNIQVPLQIYDIVLQINNAEIPNIVAKNINNFLVIESSANSLIVGNGTANTDIGLSVIEQVVREYVDNVFVEGDWKQITDPVNLKIWVQDNIGYYSNTNTRMSGYNVYQTFDFDLSIVDICPGTEADDNAMITVDRDLNVEVDDYVLILNTNSIPNIDGIHKVVGKTRSTSFLIDAYIDTDGTNGKVILLKPTRFASSNDLFNTLNDTLYTSNGGGWQKDMLAYVDYINDDFDEDGNSRGGVYKCVLDYTSSNVYFELVRYQNKKANNREIKNAIAFNDFVNSLTYLEVFDPAKGIIPGVAENEIDYKSPYDIAIYNNSTDVDASIDDINYWANEYIGKVWWDLSNAIYLDYEQSTQEYRQSYWGKLYPTGSIDIYEWIRSPYPPEEYNKYSSANIKANGIQLSGEAKYELTSYGDTVYSWTEETIFDPKVGTDVTYYYFWVKNKITLPSNNRKYSVLQLSKIIEDPTSSGINWIAFTSEDTVLLGNIAPCVACDGSVLQINFANEKTSYHQEYTLLGENSKDTIIPEWLHMGLRDSIAGEDKSIYDFDYTTWDASQIFNRGDVVIIDTDFYIALSQNSSKYPSRNITHWKKLHGAVLYFDNKTQKDVARVSAPRQVPDVWIHRFARYGNLVSPRQSWIQHPVEARRVFVNKINSLIKQINLTSNVKSWNKVLDSSINVDNKIYNIRDYWKFIDWADVNYNSSKKIDKTVNFKDELNDISNPIQGYKVKVNYADMYDNEYNYSIYEYLYGVWKVTYKQRGTVQFIDELWNSYLTGAGWDTAAWDRTEWDNVPAIIIQSIFDTAKNEIFAENLEYMYADLWFTMVKYIISEQNSVDWIIKSTLTDVSVQYALNSKKSYIPDLVENFMDYFNTIKPYHTKLRNFTSKRNIEDNFNVTVEDRGKKISMVLKYNRHIEKQFSENTLNGLDNWNSSDNIDYSNFDTTEYDYIYDGNKFVQPYEEGFAQELMPMIMTDAVRILITRNTSGGTVDNNTVYPIVFSDKEDKLEYSKSDINTITTLAANISSTDTTIQITDINKVWNTSTTAVASQRGIIWINGERITYRNIDGNKLLNCVRGTKGTVAKDHLINDIVYSANSEYTSVTAPDFELKVHDWDTNLWDTTSWDKSPVLIVKI